ncbi:MAG: VWA domain-containing protein [Calditrichaeota bacterium]|nr:MAG: VWA domain-containing protein [Calditrichota bacterium]MBL1203810.1 VWA domain-containing protein [Calditrichota bacterium]NOG43640.1 VWA domain-containing protein [Calditrichota bacterium]
MFEFRDPEYLILFILLPGIVFWYFKGRRRKNAQLKYSDVNLVKRLGKTIKQRLTPLILLLRLVAFSALVLALARPQSSSKEEEIVTEGVDIVLAMDVSTSMLAEDFKPNNRLQAAKSVAREFIKSRSNDRLGMVVFAGESFTQCPLTLDYGVLLTLLEDIKIADKNWDGTAIGMGIVNAVNRLRDSKTKSKIIILLTDGVNNRGQVAPLTAAQIAKAFDIKIYTIGAGKHGTAMYPVDDPYFGKKYVPMQVDIDEEVLTNIADLTGAKYFRATDTKKLKEVYDEISELEKTQIEVLEFTRYEELFVYFLAIALFSFLVEIVLANTYFRRIP